jgi:hypothetical protein
MYHNDTQWSITAIQLIIQSEGLESMILHLESMDPDIKTLCDVKQVEDGARCPRRGVRVRSPRN